MNPKDRALVVALRMAQWQLDDAAHAIPQGNYSLDKRRALAEIFDDLAAVLRDQPPRQVVERGVDK